MHHLFSLLPLGSSPSFVGFVIQENLNDFKSNCLFESLMVTELSTSTLKSPEQSNDAPP